MAGVGFAKRISRFSGAGFGRWRGLAGATLGDGSSVGRWVSAFEREVEFGRILRYADLPEM